MKYSHETAMLLKFNSTKVPVRFSHYFFFFDLNKIHESFRQIVFAWRDTQIPSGNYLNRFANHLEKHFSGCIWAHVLGECLFYGCLQIPKCRLKHNISFNHFYCERFLFSVGTKGDFFSVECQKLFRGISIKKISRISGDTTLELMQ